jgi:sarcosine oxidase
MVYDVCVVGAGLAGAAAARELAARGHAVLLLEQHAVGHRHGSSHGSSRIYRRAYADPFYVALTGRAADEWDRLEDESGAPLRVPTGELDVGAGRAETVHAALTAAGVPVTYLSSDEVADRWPGIAVGPAAYHADAGYLDADGTVRACVDLAVRHGAELREHTVMTRLEPSGDGVVVHTEGGSERVQRVVVAAGAWLPELLDGLGVAPPLPGFQVKQQELFHHRHRDPAASWPTLVHLADDAEIYALPSGRDGGPAPAYKLGQFDSRSDTTASTRDGVIDDRARRVVRAFVEEHLPGLDPEPVAEASCLFTMTPDGDFVLDRVGPVVVASPCSGHAAKFAPLTGVLIADLVEGAAPDPRFAFRSTLTGTGSWA